MFELSKRTQKRMAKAFRNSVSILCSFSMVFGNVSFAVAQQIIVDPSAPGTSFLSTDTLTPQINIATPQSGVSLNQFSSFNVDENGVILNNSTAAGVSQLGANVTGNPNLIVSGPANVIVNEVTGVGASSLVGTTEVFGQTAAVIIANPNGISCNGCDFLNAVSTTLSTGGVSINGADVSLGVSQGTISIGPDGFQTENSGGIYGRHIIIDGAVSTVNTGADNGVQIVGGSQVVTVDTDNVVNSIVSAAPILNSKLSPFGVDASVSGVITSGIVDVRSVETGLGVNLYGDVNAAHGFYAVSNGDLFYGDVTSGEGVQIFAIENVRQYGDITAASDVVIDGKSYTLYQDRRIDAGGIVSVDASEFVVIAGEVSGQDIAIDVANGSFTNTGFVLASGELTIMAGEDVLQQRGIATEYDIYFNPSLQVYIEAYQAQLLAGGAQADIAAEMLSRAAQHDVIAEYVDRGASISGTNVTADAGDNIVNTGGAIAATNDVLLTAGANIINEYLALEKLLTEADDCPAENCGYRTEFHAAEILAGNDLVLTAGSDVLNLASVLAAANNVTVDAGADIVNALTHSAYIYDAALTGDVGADDSCSNIFTSLLSRACSSFDIRSLLLGQSPGGSATVPTEERTVVVLAPALITSLYGDISLDAVGNFDSVGSEVSAGDDLTIVAGGEVYLGSFVDIEGAFVPPEESSNSSPWFGVIGSNLSIIQAFESIFGYDDEEEESPYTLTAATTNLIGRTINVTAGGNIVMTGARLMAEGDLNLASETGSILIDSTDLPDDIALTSESASFIELDNDIVGQIFGSAEFYQTPATEYTELYSDLLTDYAVVEQAQQDLLEALASQILAYIAQRLSQPASEGDSNQYVGGGHFGGGDGDSDAEPWSFADALAAVLDDDDVLAGLRQTIYYQIATALDAEFTEESGNVDISEGGIYKLLNDRLNSEVGTDALDALASDLIDEVSQILTGQLIADEAANPLEYFSSESDNLQRWATISQVMTAINDVLPAADATEEELATFRARSVDDDFMRSLTIALINKATEKEGYDLLFVADPETGEYDTSAFDIDYIFNSPELQRVVLEISLLFQEQQVPGGMTYGELRQSILDDSTDADSNTYGVLPQLIKDLRDLLRDETDPLIEQRQLQLVVDRVLDQDIAAILADAVSQDMSSDIVAALAEDLGDQALSEVDDRIANNSADYLRMLTKTNVLTAVETLRRAESGADIKDAMRAVGVQSFETLFQGMEEAELAQQIADASDAIHTTFNTDLDALNTVAWANFGDIQQQIEALELAIFDVNSTVDPVMMQTLLAELATLETQYSTDLSAANATYQAEVDAATDYWDDEIDDAGSPFFGCNSTCQALKAQKQNALNALAADYQTTLASMAAANALDRVGVFDQYATTFLNAEMTALDSGYLTSVTTATADYQADIVSTTEYWDDEIADIHSFLCPLLCPQLQEQKEDALDDLDDAYEATIAGLEIQYETDQQGLMDQYNVDLLEQQVAGFQADYDAAKSIYDVEHAAIFTTISDQLTALNSAMTTLTNFQALLDELGSEAMAEDSVVEGESSLAAALTAQGFPEFAPLDTMQTTPEGIVTNMTESEAEQWKHFVEIEAGIDSATQTLALGEVALAQLLADQTTFVDTQYSEDVLAADALYLSEIALIEYFYGPSAGDGVNGSWAEVVAEIFPGRHEELCGETCSSDTDKKRILNAIVEDKFSVPHQEICSGDCSSSNDRNLMLAAYSDGYQDDLTALGADYAIAQDDAQFAYNFTVVQQRLADLQADFAAKPDFVTRAIISADQTEQDDFLAATAWRFSLFGGMEQLDSTPRSIVYAGNDLNVYAGEDIYIEGATTLAAGEDVAIEAERRIGLLAAVNTNFRLTEDGYAAFTEIGETLQLGTLMRNPYSSESESNSSDVSGDEHMQFAERTRNYTLASTVITSGGDLVLAANGDDGEILNFGGSLLAGENLVVSATTDIRNEALRSNFTLTKSDGCGGKACGNTGHDYRPAEMLAGSGMIITAGQDIINTGSIMSAAGSLLASAEGDIVNQAITSQYMYYYVNHCGVFCITRKKKKLYRAAISEGVMTTEYGDLILESGANILNEGSVFSAGAAVNLTAAGDINLTSISEELKNYYKRRGFSGLSFGSTTTKWNEFSTAIATVEGNDIYMTADGNITGMGSVLMAYGDIDLVAGENLTFDAHQNQRYNYSHGWSIGISFGGSGLIEALIGGGDLLEAYTATNPALAAVHQLATGEGKWDTLNGALALGYHLPALGSAINQGARNLPSIADSLAANINPFGWTDTNPLFNSDLGPAEDFTDYLNGITIRLGFFSSKQEWTESHFSKLISGNDLRLHASEDLALVGGTSASASNNASLYAGENVLLTALADWSWSESNSWGASVGFSSTGYTFGFDYSGSNSNGTLYTNALLTAGADLDIMSIADTTLMGANIQGHNVYMVVGENLTLASQQNTSHSDSFGFNFSTSGSFGLNISDANREYTDNVSSIVASNNLSIYVDDTTYLLGATLASNIGNLELDTGTLVFDNYVDSDVSIGVGINGNFSSSTDWDVGGSVDYSNTQGITHATIGDGTITLRDWEDFDLSELNRDIDNVQEITSSKEFHIVIPGVNLKRWSEQVVDSLNLLEAVATHIPDQIGAEGALAVNAYRDLILRGMSPEDARVYSATPDFRFTLNVYGQLASAADVYGGVENIPEDVISAIYLGETIRYIENSDGEVTASIEVPCATSGITCAVAVLELATLLQNPETKDALHRFITIALEKADSWLPLVAGDGTIITVGHEWNSFSLLLQTLIWCAENDPEFFAQAMASDSLVRSYIADFAFDGEENLDTFLTEIEASNYSTTVAGEAFETYTTRLAEKAAAMVQSREDTAAWFAEHPEVFRAMNQVLGALQAVGGAFEMIGGTSATVACSAGTAGVGVVACTAGGALIVFHGADNMSTGIQIAIHGVSQEMLTSQLLRTLGEGLGLDQSLVEFVVATNEIIDTSALALGLIRGSSGWIRNPNGIIPTNNTGSLPPSYTDLGNGWIRGPSGGRAWDTGYTVDGLPVFQRESGGYYIVGADGRQISTGSPKPHGNTLDNTPTEIYRRVSELDEVYQKIGVSQDAHSRYAAAELGLDDIIVVGTRPRDQAVKIERFIAERWPGPLNNEPWAGARNPNHPNYDPNYIPFHMR